MKFSYDYLDVKDVRALLYHVLVVDMKFEERRTDSGIILRNDDMKSVGIRPRWARVFRVGPDQHDIRPDQYICVQHGRWTRGVKIRVDSDEYVLRRVDVNDILLVSDEPVNDLTLSDKEI